MASDIKDILIHDALNILEKAKFGIDTDDHVFVRTSVSGEIQPTGLNVAGKNTTLDITDTAAQIPGTALTNRNAISINNTSTTDTLYIGFDNTVTADNVIGTTSGRQVGPGQVIQFDVTDSIAIWGIAPTGLTIRVHIMELA